MCYVASDAPIRVTKRIVCINDQRRRVEKGGRVSVAMDRSKVYSVDRGDSKLSFSLTKIDEDET